MKVTIEEAANQTGYPLRWIKAVVDSERVPHVEEDGRRYIDVEALKDYRNRLNRNWRTQCER